MSGKEADQGNGKGNNRAEGQRETEIPHKEALAAHHLDYT